MFVELKEEQIVSKAEAEHLKRVEKLNKLEQFNNVLQKEWEDCLSEFNSVYRKVGLNEKL